MSDLFPQEPKLTQYTVAFERCWKAHPVGVKKVAWKAGEKAGFNDGNWVWLEDYLIKRHKDDEKWLEGKYVPHLATFINQERWADQYKRRSMRYEKVEQEETAEQKAQKIAQQQREWEEAKRQNALRQEMKKRGIA